MSTRKTPPPLLVGVSYQKAVKKVKTWSKAVKSGQIRRRGRPRPALPRPCVCSQTAVKYWSNTGQTFDYWSNNGQTVFNKVDQDNRRPALPRPYVRLWSNGGQTLVKREGEGEGEG